MRIFSLLIIGLSHAFNLEIDIYGVLKEATKHINNIIIGIKENESFNRIDNFLLDLQLKNGIKFKSLNDIGESVK
jgi:hypothetical protein